MAEYFDYRESFPQMRYLARLTLPPQPSDFDVTPAVPAPLWDPARTKARGLPVLEVGHVSARRQGREYRHPKWAFRDRNQNLPNNSEIIQ